MPIEQIDPNILTPSAENGTATPTPEFYDLLIRTINQLVDASGATIGFSVKDYGAVGDGATDDSVAIRTAIAAAVAAGGGIVFFPDGTYLVSLDPTSTQGGCIHMVSGVQLWGQSRQGAIIKMKSGQVASTRALVAYQISDARVWNLTINGNSGAQIVDEHMAAIFIRASTRVTIEGCTMTNAQGDGVAVYQDNVDINIVECHIYANLRAGVSISGSGQTRTSVIRCYISYNTGGQQIDMEPADGIAYNTLVDGCYLEGDEVVVALGGTIQTDDHRARGVTFVNNVVNGCVFVIWADDVRFANNLIITKATDSSPPLEISGLVQRAAFVGNVVRCGGTSGHGILFSGRSVGDSPLGVELISNYVAPADVAGVAGQISLYGAEEVACIGNTVVGDATTILYGIEVRSVLNALPMRTIRLEHNYIRDMHTAILCWGVAGTEVITDLVMIGNVADKLTRAAMSAWDLDYDSFGVVKRAVCIGNETINCDSDWVSYPAVPMLVAGNRGGGGTYSSAGDPNGVITEVPGATCISRGGGAGTTLYVKEAAGSSSVWAAK